MSVSTMTVREIQSHLQEMYGTEVSPSLISCVTDAVSDEVKAWQARPLDAIYPIVYMDCIHVKVREGAVRVKAVYLAIGITMGGEKEVLGLWLAQTESLSGILCSRHSMTTRSIYANQQDKVEERGHRGQVGGVAGVPGVEIQPDGAEPRGQA